MKKKLFTSIPFLILLSACGAIQTTTPVATSMIISSQSPMETPAPVTSTPPSPTPTGTPNVTNTAVITPTATPLSDRLGPENFDQFSLVQVYGDVVENAIFTEFGIQPGESRIDIWSLSPDGSYLAIGGCTTLSTGTCYSNAMGGGNVFLYILDAKTAEIVVTVPESETQISGLAFTPDNSKLLYAVCPLRLSVWDMTEQKIERNIWQESGCRSKPKISVSPDGKQVALVSDNRLLIFDLTTNQQIIELPARRFGSVLPKYSANGTRLAVFSADDGYEISIYDTASWKRISRIQSPRETGAQAVDISPDGNWLVTAYNGENPDILVWDTTSGEQVAVIDETFLWIDTLAFAPNGQMLFSGGFTEDYLSFIIFNVWDLNSGESLGSLYGITPSIRVMFSADGTSFSTGDSLWSLPDAALRDAHQAVISLFAALAAGDTQTAAQWYAPDEEQGDYLLTLGIDPTDPEGTLQAICGQESAPCLPVQEILFGGMWDRNNYLFLMHFTAPDGSSFQGTDGDTVFWVYVQPQSDGSMRVINLPSFFLPQ